MEIKKKIIYLYLALLKFTLNVRANCIETPTAKPCQLPETHKELASSFDEDIMRLAPACVAYKAALTCIQPSGDVCADHYKYGNGFFMHLCDGPNTETIVKFAKCLQQFVDKKCNADKAKLIEEETKKLLADPTEAVKSEACCAYRKLCVSMGAETVCSKDALTFRRDMGHKSIEAAMGISCKGLMGKCGGAAAVTYSWRIIIALMLVPFIFKGFPNCL